MDKTFIEVLKEQLETLVRHGVMFEKNIPSTQRWFRSATNVFLSGCSSKNFIRDYIVVCDDTTNTEEILARNAFTATIYFRMNSTDDFTVLNVLCEAETITYE